MTLPLDPFTKLGLMTKAVSESAFFSREAHHFSTPADKAAANVHKKSDRR
jgi:hypothetical protein